MHCKQKQLSAFYLAEVYLTKQQHNNLAEFNASLH
jgi:hypothetical protein